MDIHAPLHEILETASDPGLVRGFVLLANWALTYPTARGLASAVNL